MRKIRLLALTLFLIMMFSTVMGCGSNKDTADADATDEEPTVEDTTETVEETETEYRYSTTYSYSLDNERYPVSDETKAMLIEKLTGLTLKKNDEFDFSTLSFKEDEQKACDRLKVLLTDVMFAEKSENDKIVCNLDYVKIDRIDQTYKGLFFYFEQGNRYDFSNKREIVNELNFEIDYSLYTISDETKAMLIEKLTNLELEKGQIFDMDSLTFKADEIQAKNKMKSILVYVLSSASNSNILECKNTRVELYKIDSNSDGMDFYFRKIIIR